jgi:hypothetical protein
MHWIVLGLLVVTELLLVLLILQFIVGLRLWLRWAVWLMLLVLLATVADQASQAAIRSFRSNPWEPAAEVYSLHAPYPTFRVFLFGGMYAIPMFWLLCGLASLLRRGSTGLKIVVWELPRQTTYRACLVAAAALLLMLVVHDRWIVYRIHQLQKRAIAIANETTPPVCNLEENAAPLYLAAMSQAFNARGQGLPRIDHDINVLSDDLWREYIARNRETAAQLRRAAVLPRCRFDIDYSRASILVAEPEFELLWGAIHVLYIESRFDLLNGESQLAIENAQALRNLSVQLALDPRESAFTYARSADQFADRIIEHLAYVNAPTQDQVRRLTRSRRSFKSRLDPMFHRLEANYSNGIAEMYLGLADDEEQNGNIAYQAAFQTSKAFTLFRMRLLYAPDDIRLVSDLFLAMRAGAGSQFAPPEFVRARPQEPLWRQIDHAGPGYLINSWLHTDLLQFLIAEQSDMHRALFDYGLLVASEHRPLELVQGDLSRTLPPGNRPLDTFREKNTPIGAVLADGGVVLYSAGWDYEDNGGMEGERTEKGYRSDMTFCLGEAYRIRRLMPPPAELDPTESEDSVE